MQTVGLEGKLQDLYRELCALEAAYLTQKIAFFNPISDEQRRFFREQTADIRLVRGHNRSGKSVCGIVEAISHSLGYRPWLPEGDPDRIVRLKNGQTIPVPNVGRVIVQDFEQAVKQNIYEKLREWAPYGAYTVRNNGRGVPTEVRWTVNGSVWYILSDNQDDIHFEGTRGHWFWGDEPFGYRKYTALRRGLVDFSGHCWLTLTPLSQFWIQDIIEQRANDPDGKVKLYQFSIWDNEVTKGGYLSKDAIEDYIADLREDEKAARVGGQGGEWLHMTGRRYKEWDPVPPYWIEPFTIPVSWPRICVIDPHPRKPVAVAWWAMNPDGQIYMYRELFDERLNTIEDVANRIKALEEDEIIAARLIDPAAKEHERTSGKSVWSSFAEHGIWAMPAPKRNAEAGYQAIHEALKIRGDWQQPGLVVFNTCPTMKRNFMRFVWKDWTSSRERDLKGERQEVLKNEDDFIDTARYIYQAGLTYDGLRGMMKQQRSKESLQQKIAEISDLTGDMYFGRHIGSRRGSAIKVI